MVTLTEKAGTKIKDLLTSQQKAGYGLRVFVSGGGCHGFQYGMSFEEKPHDGDQIVEMHGVRVFIDTNSIPHLKDSEIDYVDAIHGAGFAIKNPNAKSSCGCGSSFGT